MNPAKTLLPEERPNGKLSRAFPRTQSGTCSSREAQGRRLCDPRTAVANSDPWRRRRARQEKSIIKRFTFFGALTGGLSGFLLAAGTAVLYLHPTGGRPIITIPPFLIITYELTILFGILATVLGFFISARLPAIRERIYVPEAAVDKFAVAVADRKSVV